MIKLFSLCDPRLGWAAASLALVAFSGVLSAPLASAEADGPRVRFARQLCDTALRGGFPKIDLAELIAATGEGREAVCGCTAELYAAEGPEAHAAVQADMRSGLSRNDAFYRHLVAPMWQCVEPTEEEGFGLGEALVNFVLQCEGVVKGDDRLAGLDLRALRRGMGRAGLDAEKICGCSGDYYLEHHKTVTAEILSEAEGENAYDRHMAKSLEMCLDFGGVWPTTASDPAFDPEMDGEGLCRAVLSRSIELADFDYAAQVRWEQGAGLGPEDVCGCVGPRSLDRLEEEGALDLIEIVLEEIPACRRALWKS